ncbi:MAG: hypothetical protein ACT4PE_06670 [Candidatus Eiseniibacteriota bacterium]
MKGPALCACALLSLAAPAGASESPQQPTVTAAAREWLDSSTSPAGFLDPAVPDDWEQDDWDWAEPRKEQDPSGRKSLLKAVAASALLPGLGERYVGHDRRAKLFHAAEFAIWGTYVGYEIQGDRRRDRYEEFAVVNAGAASSQDSDYYEHIGLWISLEEWHDIVRRDARLQFPDDPAAQALFFEQNKRYDEGEEWAWEDDDARIRYRQLRSRSERSYRNGRLAVGAAIVNRLASMMDALALARSHNRKLGQESHLDLRIAPEETVNGLVVGPVFTARY